MSINYSKRRRKWDARIQVNGATHHLGYWSTEAEAREAIERAKSGDVADVRPRREPGIRPLPFAVPPAPPHRSSASRVSLFPKSDPEKEARA